MTGILNLLMGTVRSAVVTDPYFEYTTLLLPGSGTNGAQNNTFLDGSTNNFTITRNGNTTQGTFSPFSQTGWGNYFDGTTDNLKVSNNAAFQFGTTAFTIEFWVYLTTTSGSPQFICCYQNSSTGYNIALNASAVLICNLSGDGSDITGTTTVQANQWNHIALSGTGGTSVKLFLNGVQEGSTFTGATSLSPGTYPFTIGSFAGGGFGDANFITGYMSNVRVVKGTAVYTGNFTPPSLAPLTTAGSTSAASYPSTTNVNTSFASSETSLLTCQSNRFRDASTNNFTITVNGDTRVVAFSPFNPTSSWSAVTNGGSGYFDGNSDWLKIDGSTAFNFGSGDFTIEGWLYPQGGAATAYTVSYSNGTASNSNFSFEIGTTTTKAISGGVYIGSTGYTVTGTTTHPNEWVHFALVRNGTASGNLKLYVNGVSEGTPASIGSSSINTLTGTTYLTISGFYNGGGTFYTGYMSDMRLVKGTAVYTSAFTPPTAPLTATQSANTNGNPSAAITGTATSLLLNFTNAGIYDATSKNDLETVDGAQISNTTAKWGTTSMKFDGTGDYLVGTASDLFSFGTGDFTIDFWIYVNSVSSTQVILDTRATSTDSGLALYLNPTKVSVFTSNAVAITSTSSMTTSVWNYVALRRSSGTLAIYINSSTADVTQSYTSAITGPGRIVLASRFNNIENFNGYIQDFRITKGYARSIVVPTAAFPTL